MATTTVCFGDRHAAVEGGEVRAFSARVVQTGQALCRRDRVWDAAAMNIARRIGSGAVFECDVWSKLSALDAR
jgi:hypothetical protein